MRTYRKLIVLRGSGDRELKQRRFLGVLVMMERSATFRRCVKLTQPRVCFPSYRIGGVHPCVVRNINAFGACLSTPYYMFARDFDLSFSGFHKTLACRVVWRRATIFGVVFGLRRRGTQTCEE